MILEACNKESVRIFVVEKYTLVMYGEGHLPVPVIVIKLYSPRIRNRKYAVTSPPAILRKPETGALLIQGVVDARQVF